MTKLLSMILGAMILLSFSSPCVAGDNAVALVQMGNLGGIDDQDMKKANDLFEDSVKRIKGISLLDSSLVQKSMAGKKRCSDDACLASVGKAIGARWLVYGSVMRFGGVYVLKLRVIDVKAARSITSTTNQIKEDWGAVLKMLPLAVSSLFSSAALGSNPQGVAGNTPKPIHKRSKMEQKKVDEFERMLAKAEQTKELKERIDQAWNVALKLASDEQLHVDVRRHALARFMHKFRKNNPYYRAAYQMWKDLRPAILVIKTLPPGALIAINGTVVGSAPLRREVEEGKYRIVASRIGFQNSVQSVSVAKGQSAVVTLLLPRKIDEHPFNTWGHVTFWSGLGLAVFGGASMGLAVKYANSYEASGSYEDRHSSSNWSTMMWLGFGSGAALMLTGAVLWLLEPPASERVQRDNVTSVAPTPDGKGAVFSISGMW